MALAPPHAPRPLAELPPIAARGQLATAPDEIHVWYAFVHEARDPDLVAAYDALQTDEERARQARYVRAADRELHRLTRALQRAALSRYAPVAPSAWRFDHDDFGKPRVVGPPGVVWPAFNLSNAAGLVACAVSTTVSTLGVDVEDSARAVELELLADRYFAPSEAAALRALPPAARAERFFSYWTLKEAFIKACGQGLSIPLDQFAFDLAPAEITAVFDPRLAEDAAAWRYALFRASPDHLAAVAARVGRARPLVIKATRATPLRDALDAQQHGVAHRE